MLGFAFDPAEMIRFTSKHLNFHLTLFLPSAAPNLSQLGFLWFCSADREVINCSTYFYKTLRRECGFDLLIWSQEMFTHLMNLEFMLLTKLWTQKIVWVYIHNQINAQRRHKIRFSMLASVLFNFIFILANTLCSVLDPISKLVYVVEID